MDYGKMAVILFFVAFLLIGLVIFLIHDVKTDGAARRIRARWEREEKTRQERIYGGGTWPFPTQDFYKVCIEAGIKQLDSSYAVNKARALADEIMRSKNVREQYWPLYDSDHCLETYFAEGRELEESERTRLNEEKLAYQREAHDAALTDQQKEMLSFNSSLAEEYGTEKRKAMLNTLKGMISEKILAIKQAQVNMQKLSVMLAQSTSQTKTVDAAVVAGLANGIGGAGAALYATADAMSRNAQIEAENRRNREAVNQLATSMYSNSFELSSDIRTLEKQREPYDKALKELRTKVVIEEAGTQELFKSLEIGKPSVEKLESGALSVKTSLKTSYRPHVPENIKTTVDGTLTGKVYAGDLFVCECVLPLPLYGVECGNPNPTEAETLCARFAANDQPYRVEFTPNKLWVMEL